jgi:hypothetical protein
VPPESTGPAPQTPPPAPLQLVATKAAQDDGEKDALRERIKELESKLALKDSRPMGMAKSIPGAALVLVENTSERMHAISDGQPKDSKGVRVKKPYVNLWPGLNKVPAADWDRALKEPMVQLQIRIRTFAERARINRYEDLSESDAVALLGTAWEPNLLKDWAGKDARPNVQDAIKRQYDQITGERANPDKPAQRTTMKAFAARMAGNG